MTYIMYSILTADGRLMFQLITAIYGDDQN